MRMGFRRALTAGTMAGIALVWTGCEGKKQTEFVTGISTQVRVPRDLRTIRVEVNSGGVPVLCRSYPVYDGRVRLPRSLGELPNNTDSGQPISVAVVGFTEDISTLESRDIASFCAPATFSNDGSGARVLRRTRQSYVKDKILFLPMALSFSCWDKGCDEGSPGGGADKTCKAGRCVDASLDASRLSIFVDGMDEGSGGSCFHAKDCVGPAAVPAAVVNSETCTYALPNTPSAPPQAQGAPPNPFPKTGDGINVIVTYDGGYNSEVLDLDPDEGFFIPDPSKPQQFQLAPGLCDLVKGVDPQGKDTLHRITAVRGAGICQPKKKTQFLCTDDGLAAMGADGNGGSTTQNAPVACSPHELKPAKSVLHVLADNTENSGSFYNGADRAALSLSLSDPSFSKTSVGLTFFPGDGAACSAGPRAVEPKLAKEARDLIAGEFAKRADGGAVPLRAVDTNTDLDAALSASYTFLEGAEFQSYYRRAVLVLGNRGFEANACNASTPSTLAAQARANANRVDTYVIMLSNNSGTAPQDPLIAGNQLALSGGTPHIYDGRVDKSQGQAAFQQILKDLATCVYEDPAPPKSGAVLSYSEPLAGTTKTITYNETCNQDGATASGWGIDKDNPQRVRVCGQACEDYRTVLQNAAAYAAQNLQPALAVPIFAHKIGCEPPAN